jgi:hypothetical protein
MKPTLANLRRLATKVGATVDSGVYGLSWDCHVDLPAGKIIASAHGRSETCLASDRQHRARCLAALIDWIQQPVEDGCELDHPDECDVCRANDNV